MHWKVFRRTCWKFVKCHLFDFIVLAQILFLIITTAIGTCIAGESGSILGFGIGLFGPTIIAGIVFLTVAIIESIKDAVTEFKDMYLAGLDKSDK